MPPGCVRRGQRNALLEVGTVNTILTLCEACADTYQTAPGIRIKKVVKATTEKQPYCEACKRKSRYFDQYHVQSGR